MSKTQQRIVLPAIITVALFIFVVWASHFISWQNGLDQLHTNNEQQLQQFAGHLDAQLARFQFLPQLIAKNDLLVELLNNPESAPRVDLVNHFLEEINSIIGASDTYLMNPQGLTLAASNWESERPFVGRNFNFRPYFLEAMEGKLGRYFALGTTSGERGYYFAYPITYAADYIGVVVIKMDLSNIEQRWSNRDIQFIVNDPDGVIFITTRPDWLYRSIYPLSSETQKKIRQSRRYGRTDIKKLGLKTLETLSADSAIVELNDLERKILTTYLTLNHDMPTAGWSVLILAPLKGIKKVSLITDTVVILIALLLLLIGLLRWQRYKRQQERERFQREARKQLEHEVSVRTADLRHEIDEHKRTENTLRDTQDELIQTAKLAVLGQMSASIGHELNNPLAAIRSYADNARQFLVLNQTSRADENLDRIAELTERMGKISSQLKFFAKKSAGNLDDIKLKSVILSSIEIVTPQYKNQSIHVNTDRVETDAVATGNAIQLEQVLVNLINNAVNAMSTEQGGVVTISTEQDGEWILIHVDDQGPGIDKENLARIFEPFFTTRETGLGLGLSISARIIDSMRGRLSALNLTDGGARFTLSLLRVK